MTTDDQGEPVAYQLPEGDTRIHPRAVTGPEAAAIGRRLIRDAAAKALPSGMDSEAKEATLDEVMSTVTDEQAADAAVNWDKIDTGDRRPGVTDTDYPGAHRFAYLQTHINRELHCEDGYDPDGLALVLTPMAVYVYADATYAMYTYRTMRKRRVTPYLALVAYVPEQVWEPMALHLAEQGYVISELDRP